MKRILIMTIMFMVSLLFVSGLCVGPAFADSKPTMTVLKMCEEEMDGENGEGIKCILNLVVNVLTYGIGVLGVAGIVFSGIQYTSSQGDPAKMAKAKNRIIQIIIGLVIYAVMYAALAFLVPGWTTPV